MGVNSKQRLTGFWRSFVVSVGGSAMPRWAAGFLVAIAAACAGEPSPPSGSISSEQAQKLILERDDARDAGEARERELLREIESLKAEMADLRSQLGMAEETAAEAADRAERFEAGLGRAVDELNQVSQVGAAVSTAPARRASTRQAAEPHADVSYYSDPRVSIVDRSVVASGRLYNSGDAEAVGTLYVDLLRNGAVVDTKDRPLTVGANSWASWQEEFKITPGGASLSVRARMEF